jgi:hypothetical protein
VENRRADIVAPMDAVSWQLWRQDDNGNRYRMKIFDDRLAALAEALVFTARGHRQLYDVVGPPGPALRTNADLYALCRKIPAIAGDRDLRTYLLTLYRLGAAVRTQSTLAAETFGALLLAAATAEPPDVDPAWRRADLSIPDDRPLGYDDWRRVLLAQAADLADFAEDPPDPVTVYFGMDCRHPADAGPRSCAGYWYNQHLAGYLECAAAGAFGGFGAGDRIPTTADVVPPPPERLPALGWDRLIAFAWAGQSYE